MATSDEAATKKRFLSRTARYSGLLNILNIVQADLSNLEQVKPVLQGAEAWIAFNVPREDILTYSKAAIEANIKRVVVTTELSSQQINDTSLPEFNQAIEMFQNSGGYFTGVRHGEVVPGDENNVYEILNATTPCVESFVERGVLGRVVAELLQIERSGNIECGVSSSNEFAGAYLNVLRSSGLTRREEVDRVLNGGVQRVMQLKETRVAERKKLAEERKQKEVKDEVCCYDKSC